MHGASPVTLQREHLRRSGFTGGDEGSGFTEVDEGSVSLLMVSGLMTGGLGGSLTSGSPAGGTCVVSMRVVG